MRKPRYKTTNRKLYYQALIIRGSLTFWIDEEAISAWKATNELGKKGRQLVFSDLEITTVLMVKRIFSMPLRAQPGFINSVFKLANEPLFCSHYTYISKYAKTVSISFKTKTRSSFST